MKKYLLQIIFTIISILGFSQIEDSLYSDPFNTNTLKEDTAYVAPKPKPPPPPYMQRVNRVRWIPGYGQFLNKKYHKIPLFLGGLGYTIYKQREANSNYKFYLEHLDFVLDDDINTTNTSGVDDIFLPETLRNLAGERTFWTLMTAMIWTVNMADAKVDAFFVIEPNGNHRPRKAAIYSAIFPGLGQIYNRKYWKLPILYGGAAALFYSYTVYDEEFNLWNTSYVQKSNNIAENEFQTPEHYQASAATLERYAERSRKRRERMIIYSFLLYAGNILDAAVDAHLSNFNINESIDISFTPMPSFENVGLGMNIKFDLK